MFIYIQGDSTKVTQSSKAEATPNKQCGLPRVNRSAYIHFIYSSSV
jgi:hypothetical protein